VNSAGETPGFWPAGDAARFLEDRDFVIPVLGAGVSTGAGLPGAQDLAAWIVKNVPPRGAGYTNAANPALFTVAGEAGVEDQELRRRVASWLSEWELRSTALAEALVRVPSNFIITLNYDLLLEETTTQAGIDCESLTSDEAGLKRALDLVSDLEHWPPKRLVVLHLHGSVNSPETIVLDPSSYQRLDYDGRFSDLVLFLMRQKTMLFMGTTLDELHLLSEMRKARSDTRHVLLCRADQKAGLTEGRAGITKSRDGIVIATFSTYTELDGFAAKLATVNPVPIPSTPAIAGPRARRLAFGYVPTVLVEHGAAELDESERLAAVFFGKASGPEPLGEIDVALGQRTLIVGAPGSGKSELLREAGSRVPEDESAVLIRCAELQVESGDASTILGSWAARGEGLKGEVEVSSQAIAQRRFHFFFDGLDEALISEQDSLALLIADVARAFPQHRFTVATRAVDAVGVFQVADAEHATRGEWRVLELAPDRSWQQRYLVEAAVSLEDLEAQMPALRDLSELLHLPFFLSQTVELYRAGGLRESRDLWELVENFVTAALDREAGIRLPTSEARKWLRDVALAMHLAGRTSLRLEELTEVPLPTAVENIIGSVEALTDSLIARLLMLKQGSHTYGFAHRIIGEALAAEALDELQPQGALLEAVAPQIDEQVSAVRSDWLVPLAFLMRRNPTWRAAVAERDRLGAARSVPASAPAVERREAARTIWETYVRLGVWIWNYGSPDLLQDANALAHLLQAGDLDDLLAEIRRQIDDPSPQVQGNALRVLSRVNPDGFVDDVRRVLEDDRRESVVRRQAAVAASDMGARELLALIIKRAADPANDMEAQDFSLCAFELAGEDDLVETAIQLAGSRYGRIFAESRLKEIASTSELVRFLRASAEAEPESTSHETALLADALRKIVSDD
jgi:energy-coupling factor transporter ATP-binding protein EcfA2